jgi:hypothetical protein
MKLTIVLYLLTLPMAIYAQKSPKRAAKAVGKNPIIIVDSVRITMSEMRTIDARTITAVTMLTDTDATNLYGPEAVDGVVIAKTKAYARKQYVRFFRSISPKYDSLYITAKSDSTFQYIINNKVKKQDDEGDLSLIDNDLFISLDILTADDLKNRYGIMDKTIGILIKSRKPDDLYHSRKKF